MPARRLIDFFYIEKSNSYSMKLFTSLMLAAVAGMAMPQAGATPPMAQPGPRVAVQRPALKSNPFTTQRRATIDAANARIDALQSRGGMMRAPEAQPDPAHQFTGLQYFGDIDGPDGKLWFYTATFEYDHIKHEHYTEHIQRGYTFDIYDDNMKHVGTIHDKVTYAEGELRVVQCYLLPVITKNYFNNDDNYEVVIGLYVNTDRCVNAVYRLVYSLNGEKKDGCDVPLLRDTEQVADVLDASAGGKERFYMTYSQDGSTYEPAEGEDPDDMFTNYWQKYCANYTDIVVVGPADAEGKQPELLRRRVQLVCHPGDQESTPLMMSYVHNGKATIALQYYEQPFYNEMNNPFEDDMSQRTGNNLIIELWQVNDAGDKFELQQTTKIPCVLDPADGVLASYYSIGMLRYRNDVMYEADGKAAFYITKQNYLPSSDSFEQSYYIYNADGTMRTPLFEKADRHMAMSDIEGHAPQEMFTSINNLGEYVFNFVDLSTGRLETSFNYHLVTDPDSDPEVLTANIDRVKAGDSYNYVVEMRLPVSDDDENDILRVARLAKDGKLLGIDYVNMGTDVQYATVNLDGPTLDPTFYHSDANPEYMILVKRSQPDGSSIEELLIGQARSEEYPQGRQLLLLSADDEMGTLSGMYPVTDSANPMLVVTYTTLDENSVDAYSQLYYQLPLDRPAGIDDAVTDTPGAAGTLTVSGTTVLAPGQAIEAYDMAGLKVAQGRDALSLQGFTPGIYLARTATGAAKVSVR